MSVGRAPQCQQLVSSMTRPNFFFTEEENSDEALDGA
jgi:hypothetical protein